MQALVGNPTPGQMPYTPAGGSNFAPQAPTSSSYMPPAAPQAAQLQGFGRGDDSQLVHMTPNEVNSLRGLAQQFGGDLSTNPHTGLTEMGWLGSLLPMIAGIALAATGVGAPLAAGIVAAGDTMITGDLKQGLMAGLSAFGGAGLAGMAGVTGAISSNAGGLLGGAANAAAPVATTAATTGAEAATTAATGAATGAEAGPMAMAAQGAGGAEGAFNGVLSNAVPGAPFASSAGAGAGAAGGVSPTAFNGMLSNAISGSPFATAPIGAAGASATPIAAGAGAPAAGGLGSLPGKASGLLKDFAQGTRYKIPEGAKGVMGTVNKFAPMLGVSGLMNTASNAMQPGEYKVPGSDSKSNYDPNIRAAPRNSIFDKDYQPGGDLAFGSPGGLPSLGGGPGGALKAPDVISRPPLDSREKLYFDPVMPHPTVVSDSGASDSLAKSLLEKQNSSSVWKDPKWNFADGGGVAGSPASVGSMGSKGGIPRGGTPQNPALAAQITNQPQVHMPAPVVGLSPNHTSMAGAAPNVLSRGSLDSSEQRSYAPKSNAAAPAAGTGMTLQQAIQSSGWNPAMIQAMLGQSGGGSSLATAGNSVPYTNNGIPMPPAAPTSSPAGTSTSTYNPAYPRGATIAGRTRTTNKAKGGGIVALESGGHILPAFDVATYGNGSTDAGQKRLAKMGGKPLNGKGDGVSDSIKATIDGQHPARVANGEVYFPPKAVAKLGGKAKLDAMMKAAQAARMRTRSGEKVRL